MALNKEGSFKKKRVKFSQVSNEVLRNNALSLKAKGLYSLIQSYITLDNFILYKTTLKKQCKEGDKAFESGWQELKDSGYLIQEKHCDSKGHFYYIYDLLDEVDHTPKKDEVDHTPKKEGVDNAGVDKGGSISNTNLNNTDFNNTKSINQSKDDKIDKMDISNNKQKKSPLTPTKEKATFENSNIDIYKAYKTIISDNIEYDYLKERYPCNNVIDDLLEIIIEIMISNKETIKVSGEDKPQSLVKSSFLKLNSSHIEYIIECMNKNTKKANNIKAYMIAVLYNAPKTINTYYSNLVNHDMYGV